MLQNLRISDVAVHEIFARGEDRRMVTPTYAAEVETLSPEAMDAFRLRITDALNAKAKAVEMQITKMGTSSFHSLAKALASDGTADEFLLRSRQVADRLAEVQTAQNMPGGIVIVFRGRTGAHDWPFVAVIKAEVQDGFRRLRAGETLITEFMRDLFMTRATRLYKVGFMVAGSTQIGHDNSWRCLVFDHQIVSGNREAAAIYFYESFLGCSFMEDSAYETKKFFNLTKEFVGGEIEDRSERHDIQDALYTYVKNEQAPTFTVQEFAERYLPKSVQDRYSSFMKRKQFPERAVKRDTSDLRGKLKRRRFKYGTDIEFSASPEAIAEGRVSFGLAEDDTVGDGQAGPVTTIIRIKDRFVTEL
jgi:nucleoid-associated protein YejK